MHLFFLKDYPADTKPLTRKISDAMFIKLTSETIAFTYLKTHIWRKYPIITGNPNVKYLDINKK